MFGLARFPVNRRTKFHIWPRGVEDVNVDRKCCHDSLFAVLITRLAFARSLFRVTSVCSVLCRKYKRKARFRFAIARLTTFDHQGTAMPVLQGFVTGIL